MGSVQAPIPVLPPLMPPPVLPCRRKGHPARRRLFPPLLPLGLTLLQQSPVLPPLEPGLPMVQLPRLQGLPSSLQHLPWVRPLLLLPRTLGSVGQLPGLLAWRRPSHPLPRWVLSGSGQVCFGREPGLPVWRCLSLRILELERMGVTPLLLAGLRQLEPPLPPVWLVLSP